MPLAPPIPRRSAAPVRLAAYAMACRFELALHGDDEVRLRAAGEEALAEVRRLEAKLSFYRATSDVARINAHAAEGPVTVDYEVFRLLQAAHRLHADTDGAFDPTVAPLLRAWGFVGGHGKMPSAVSVVAARERTGMQLVKLDAERRTIRFERPGVEIDLGGIGKGYALDVAAEVLRDAGVRHAFLHGGTSSSIALGWQPDGQPWNVAIPHPDRPCEPLAIVPLEDTSLSVSAVWGKAFANDGTLYGHVLDPRVGRPVAGAVLSAVVTPSATDGDALSTALLVLGRAAGRFLQHHPDARGLVACPSADAAANDGLDVLDTLTRGAAPVAAR